MSVGSPSSSSSVPSALPPLLGPDDPPPVVLLNPDASAPVLLVCDHAGRAVPKRLHDLGLPMVELCRHIAWDIGARAVTEALVARFDWTAVLCHYSRLVVDCNRAPGDPSFIPAQSDGTTVPGNLNLSEAEEQQRTDVLFWPFHHDITERLAHLRRISGMPPALIGVHSCTDTMDGVWRPWEIGVLYAHDDRMGRRLIDALERLFPELTIGDNQPYSGKEVGYTVNNHAETAGLPYVGIEIRQDLIGTPDGVALWAQRLGDALAEVTADTDLYRVEQR